ncbi:MAG TPA: 6,7-dimethyl-8-ribityllumazine synthase, partial [Candidatus Baltobacteraceae bacterium]|nr:6,7-dimethyl-8-ribityllumazine synthase [Candidatus Baltobacteraceae bacterium]
MKTESNGSARPDCTGKKFAVVSAEFYGELAAQLEDGAKRALRDCGVRDEDVSFYRVPGCFELPVAAKRIIEADEKIDGVVALGVVIRGETPHFEYVAGECARGIMTVQIASGVPIGFGVLTTDTMAQAEERADPKRGDKGYEAALAAAAVLQVPRPVVP